MWGRVIGSMGPFETKSGLLYNRSGRSRSMKLFARRVDAAYEGKNAGNY
jgi:hypothetical protein